MQAISINYNNNKIQTIKFPTIIVEKLFVLKPRPRQNYIY